MKYGVSSGCIMPRTGGPNMNPASSSPITGGCLIMRKRTPVVQMITITINKLIMGLFIDKNC
jgi:hypothetical protein